ncbi:MAG: IMP dehydrogenase [Deltaproteobacteria bacterium]|nr:IMP dehydrogenase [Deltaproteobacteria bacterium]
MDWRELEEGLTFDDVLLVPAESEIIPKDAIVTTKLSRHITLNIPLASAAMDTVTESRMAISMAQEGGIGFVHRNMPVEVQAREVEKVKKSESGMIADPVTVHPDQRIADALEVMKQFSISGLPVTRDGRLVGILTHRDLRFEKRLDRPVSEVMTKDNLVTAKPGISLEQAKEILHANRIEKLLVVDDELRLRGLITVKDIQKTTDYPNACKDGRGRLRVGGAVGVGPDREARVEALVRAGVDVLAVDTAHGHSRNVLDTVREVKRQWPDVDVVAGNVGTEEGARALVKAGADGVKVGMGVGSICTTRIISGVGMPQLTAVLGAARAVKGTDVPVIADGGVRFSGDITKAIAAGAHAIMIGSLFAGTEESPGETILFQGRTYKLYRGMGSIEAMKEGSRDRYFQGDEPDMKLVPEGIEGRVSYKGSLAFNIHQLVGGLKAGMGYCGCRTLDDLRTKTRFMKISSAGMRESHAHDVVITKEAPNYRLE